MEYSVCDTIEWKNVSLPYSSTLVGTNACARKFGGAFEGVADIGVAELVDGVIPFTTTSASINGSNIGGSPRAARC